MAMLYMAAVTRPVSLYKDRRFTGDPNEREAQLLRSTTLYVGNLSFYTTEEQVFELFSKAGEIKRIVMGLDKFKKTPCGFCFVEYFTRKDAEASVRHLSGVKLDERFIRVDYDVGFSPGRQYGRGRSGGQVRDEYRTDYDPGRGGYGHIGRMNGMQLWGDGAGGGYGSGDMYISGVGSSQGHHRGNNSRQGRGGGRYGGDRGSGYQRRHPHGNARGGPGLGGRGYGRGAYNRSNGYGRDERSGAYGATMGYGNSRMSSYRGAGAYSGDDSRRSSYTLPQNRIQSESDGLKRKREWFADGGGNAAQETGMPSGQDGHQNSPPKKRLKSPDEGKSLHDEEATPALESSGLPQNSKLFMDKQKPGGENASQEELQIASNEASGEPIRNARFDREDRDDF